MNTATAKPHKRDVASSSKLTNQRIAGSLDTLRDTSTVNCQSTRAIGGVLYVTGAIDPMIWAARLPTVAISRFAFLLKLYADSGYQGPNFQNGLACVWHRVNVEIVNRSGAGQFVVLPKRWIVERTIAWLNRCRRLAKDWDNLNPNAMTFLRWASIRLMIRRLCQTSI